jgi:hypothetical protein
MTMGVSAQAFGAFARKTRIEAKRTAHHDRGH